jgi:predicted N-acetyltransferase YhbS
VTIVRAEKPEDISHVRRVNELAFAQPTEADIVDRLRRACAESLSLVAEYEGEAFMISILDSSAMEGVSGVAKYRAEFGEAV